MDKTTQKADAPDLELLNERLQMAMKLCLTMEQLFKLFSYRIIPERSFVQQVEENMQQYNVALSNLGK